MGAVENISKMIAWMIVTGIKVIVYPIYIVADVTARICKKILNTVSSEDREDIKLLENE